MGSRRERVWAIGLAAATVLAVAGVLGAPLGPLRVPLGAVAIFCAPGYAALLVARPRRLAGVQRILLAIPLSLAITIACGVALSLGPRGVRAADLALASLACAGIGFVVAGGRAAATGAWGVDAVAPRGALWRMPGRQRALRVAGALALAGWAVWGIVLATRDRPTPYTELYILATDEAGPGVTRATFGVRNREGGARRYLLVVAPVAPPGDPELRPTVEWALAVGDGAEVTVEAREALPCGAALEARLWRDDGVGVVGPPYRVVRARANCPGPTTPAPPPAAPSATPASQSRNVAPWRAQV